MPSKKPNIAVVYFPGNNCEEETLKAVLSAGMDGKVVRWNQRTGIENYDGYIIPGGWAYEDRIRAGVITAKDPVFDIIKKESDNGKLVLGICNGAQVEMALAPNKNQFISGYYCTWVFVKAEQNKGNCVFSGLIEKDTVIPVPIAHGEGRFATKDKELLQKLIKNNQIIFRYSAKDGKIEDKFPTNPNGALYNIAAVCNKKGNVMAMMPHPERASFIRQLPDITGLKNNPIGRFSDEEKPAPASKIFESMKKHIQEEIF
jgi:phosphoribosylformylglycinamidine synthase subunit PurQ / glutaminase